MIDIQELENCNSWHISGYVMAHLSEIIAELRAARKVVEAAKYIHWQCTQQRMENLHMALKELEGGEK